MRVAILAGGQGTRLAEETEARPKPMVEIGGEPILWHIMRHYARFGHRDFVIALGYRGEDIKRHVVDRSVLAGNLAVDLGNGTVSRDVDHGGRDDWTIRLIETGLETQTGGRIRRLQPYLGNETFMLTWGDGLADVDLDALLAFHRTHGRLATVTAVRPPPRFGQLELDGDQVVDFVEKPPAEGGWINGAFFVLEPGIFRYIEGDDTPWEAEPMERLASDGQLMAYRHRSFWQCMDTIRDKRLLEALWADGTAPWKTWG